MTTKSRFSLSANRVGCYGCMVYLVLFGTAAATITAIGYPTLWVVPFMVIFLLVWFGVYWWARKRKP